MELLNRGCAPQSLFDDVRKSEPNQFRFRLSPEVVLELRARAKLPGESMTGEDVRLDAFHQHGDEMAPYERLLRDAMRGDQTLFAREDSVLAAWRVVEPVLGSAVPIHTYKPGTWGPPEAEQIAGSARWHDPSKVPDQ